MTEINEELIDRLVAAYIQGRTLKQVAAEFGLEQTLVDGLLRSRLGSLRKFVYLRMKDSSNRGRPQSPLPVKYRSGKAGEYMFSVCRRDKALITKEEATDVLNKVKEALK